jgi:hypothetical protein
VPSRIQRPALRPLSHDWGLVPGHDRPLTTAGKLHHAQGIPLAKFVLCGRQLSYAATSLFQLQRLQRNSAIWIEGGVVHACTRAVSERLLCPMCTSHRLVGLGSRNCTQGCAQNTMVASWPYMMTGKNSRKAAWKNQLRSSRRAMQLRAFTTSAAQRGNRTALRSLSLPRAATGACALAACRTMAHPISYSHRQAPRSTTCVVASSLPALNVPVRASD